MYVYQNGYCQEEIVLYECNILKYVEPSIMFNLINVAMENEKKTLCHYQARCQRVGVGGGLWWKGIDDPSPREAHAKRYD